MKNELIILKIVFEHSPEVCINSLLNFEKEIETLTICFEIIYKSDPRSIKLVLYKQTLLEDALNFLEYKGTKQVIIREDSE